MNYHCRMCVNNDKDLAVCRREINIISNLTGHKNLICYVDSQINQTEAKVHEVLLLMPYHKVNLHSAVLHLIHVLVLH